MKLKKIKQNVGNAAVIFILSLFFMPLISNAEDIPSNVQAQSVENAQRIENIEARMIDLKENYRLLYDGAKNQNDQLSNQISFFSYVFTILGIFLAVYVSIQYEKIKKMKEIVEDTRRYIDEHNRQLFVQIKRDETVELLNRLIDVPEDISNISPLLFSRDLLEEDYIYLKAAYYNIGNHDLRTDKGLYITLFMQHFPYQCLKDIDLKTEMISNINVCELDNMFNRDIENLFDEVFKYLKEFGINDNQNRTIIKNLFYSLSLSNFKNNTEVRLFIIDTVLKYKFKGIEIMNIAKEQVSGNGPYEEWLKSILIF